MEKSAVPRDITIKMFIDSPTSYASTEALMNLTRTKNVDTLDCFLQHDSAREALDKRLVMLLPDINLSQNDSQLEKVMDLINRDKEQLDIIFRRLALVLYGNSVKKITDPKKLKFILDWTVLADLKVVDLSASLGGDFFLAPEVEINLDNLKTAKKEIFIDFWKRLPPSISQRFYLTKEFNDQSEQDMNLDNNFSIDIGTYFFIIEEVANA